MLNDWTLHPSDDDGIALTNSTTDNNQWKQFDSFNTANAPYLSLTYAADVPPQINSAVPARQLLLGVADAGAAGLRHRPGQLAGRRCSTVHRLLAGGHARSRPPGMISAGDWTGPDGRPGLGADLLLDGPGLRRADYSAAPDIQYFATPVPQPLITSDCRRTTRARVRSGGGELDHLGHRRAGLHGRAGAVGERDYNSLDPRTAGAFGAGWSSVLDMRASPGQADSSGATATEVVTYPDGEQVGFGLNADGSYHAAAGPVRDARGGIRAGSR